jgi:hypothetical protein
MKITRIIIKFGKKEFDDAEIDLRTTSNVRSKINNVLTKWKLMQNI